MITALLPHIPLQFAYTLLTNEETGAPLTPMEYFTAGGPVMWPILAIIFVGITVVVERMLFIMRENSRRQPEVVEKMLECVERRDIDGALAAGKQSKDFIARILVYTLSNKE